MEGLMRGKAARYAIAAAIAALATVAAAVGCQDSLALKAEVKERVDQEKYWLHGIKTLADGQNFSPVIAVNGNNVYVLYYDLVANQLKLIKSSDKAKTWGGQYIVTPSTGNYNTSNNIVVDGSDVYISYTTSTNSIFFLKLSDTGSGFTPVVSRTVTTAGYENSIAVDSQYAHIVYWNEGPLYAYAAKSTMSSFTPSRVDLDLNPGTSATRTETSTFIDSDGKVNTAYFDFQNDYLKLAVFSPTAVIPMTVNRVYTGSIISKTYITAADSPSAVSPNIIAFYDTTTRTYKLFEHYSYGYGIGPLYTVMNTVDIDATSANVGLSGILKSFNGKLYTAYFDATNKKLKFAVGVQAAKDVDFAFSQYTICTIGSTSSRLSFVVDPIDGTCYIAFYDSSGSGALKLAKSSDGGATW